MRTSILLTCLILSLTATGCRRSDWRWPTSRKTVKPAPKPTTPTATTQPTKPPVVTPSQEVTQLRQETKTLRQRLGVLESENKKLRAANADVDKLRETLEKQTFTLKMQAEDIKILKSAAKQRDTAIIERDLYKTRCTQLEKEVENLTAQVVKLLKAITSAGIKIDPDKTPTTKPSGQ
ncbi:MAG: hypothetical protein GY794_04990 [bacterium]|nr:hypothetical protein [bacterium]